jgi:cytochrome c oxidase cbb3-type subunit 3
MSQMPSFGKDGLLKPEQVNDLTEYVIALMHKPADKAAVERAAPVYAQQCAVCHMPDGVGNPAVGAPNLTLASDKNRLYGADRQSIHDQIWFGRGGVMPAWGKRLDEASIKAVTVYVHVNSGGAQTASAQAK